MIIIRVPQANRLVGLILGPENAEEEKLCEQLEAWSQRCDDAGILARELIARRAADPVRDRLAQALTEAKP